jgi:hypothetical protein
MWNNFPSFLTCFSYFCCPFTPGKQPYFEIIEMTTHREPARTVTHARDHWWTLDFANAFVSPAFPGNMVDFRRRCIKLMRARELFPANFAFRCFAYYWMGCWSLQHCDSLVFESIWDFLVEVLDCLTLQQPNDCFYWKAIERKNYIFIRRRWVAIFMLHCFEQMLRRTWYDRTLYLKSVLRTAEQSGKFCYPVCWAL